MKTTVAVARCSTYCPADLDCALDAILAPFGGLERFVRPGQRVLIKPNCIAAIPPQRAGQTDATLIVALAKRVADLGATPMIGDSPAWGRLSDNLEIIGALAPLRQLGAHIVPFRRAVKVPNYPMRVYRSFTLAREVVEADCIINLPKLKAHKQLALTAAIKNMFGCVAGKRKAWWHFQAGDGRNLFGLLLVELFDRIRPSLTIVDGIVGQEGDGPIHGRARNFGWLIGGLDGIAIERVCAELLGFAADELRTLSAAQTLGIGQVELDGIEIVGRSIQQERISDFARAELIPIRFSALRVIKSTLKNLLARKRG